eukprot:TRINITY_DN97839_c0_g1_i1.p1 TRINITY_DN97839_c0_g1~~TRINITY_DN97839_c0_g1_i1.p1  ORF type:complete len:100 (-),score=5.10 TRINITY_DN97839_c0_g1_i1:55-354(-)
MKKTHPRDLDDSRRADLQFPTATELEYRKLQEDERRARRSKVQPPPSAPMDFASFSRLPPNLQWREQLKGYMTRARLNNAVQKEAQQMSSDAHCRLCHL